MLTVSVILLQKLNLDLYLWLSGVVQQGPEICQSFLPDSTYLELYRALVCGVSLPAGEEKQLFIDTGLIHLMVVSGSHLVFLESLFVFLPRTVQIGLLGTYCFLTGFQPPVMRAFFRRLVAPAASTHLGFTSLQVEALSVLCVLLLFPDWLFSRSFLMSWMCGLALCSPAIWPTRPALDVAVKSYLFMVPFCFAMPVTVFWNTVLAPAVGVILFPACLLATVIHPLHAVADVFWLTFLNILKNGPQGAPSMIFIGSSSLWPLPIVLHTFLMVMEVKWRRASAFSYS